MSSVSFAWIQGLDLPRGWRGNEEKTKTWHIEKLEFEGVKLSDRESPVPWKLSVVII